MVFSAMVAIAKPYDVLADRDERSTAHLAARARHDTIYGGAKALLYAKRLQRMGSKLPLMEVVGDVYAASTGHWSPVWEAWECPECGSAWLGQERALNCCSEQEQDETNE